MATTVTRKKAIITGVVIFAFVLGIGIAFAHAHGYLGGANNGSRVSKTGTEYQDALGKTRDQVDELIQAGDAQSSAQADALIATQVTAADESQNTGYIVESNLAKASLLIRTNRAQQALDDVLLPLEQKYGTDATYKDNIAASISWAYRTVGDSAKAEEYYQKLPKMGWNS